jgi:hypothetical protein
MVFIAIDREVSLAIENDVVVDHDFCLSHHRRRTVAIKRMRTATKSDGVADTLLGAWKDLAPGTTGPAGSSRSTGSTSAVLITAPD